MRLKSLIGKIPFVKDIHQEFLARCEERQRKSDFCEEFQRLSRLLRDDERQFEMLWEDRYPCLNDKQTITGFDPHYIYHPAWAARILKRNQPAIHVDISSTLAFATMISAFIPIQFYEYHPVKLQLSDLSFHTVDLMNLPFQDKSIGSLSCMHVIEHVGLGRYGDSLDASGDWKAANELSRVLAPGGNLLVVVPVGKPKILFNAHRIYSMEQVLELFSELQLIEHALVPDDIIGEGFLLNPGSEKIADQKYGCGCFWFQRVE